MKKTILKTASLCLLAAGLTFVGCKKDEKNPAITISSLKAGSTDLNGATSATGVMINSTIVATFSTTVDAATANTTNITLSSGSTSTNVGLSVTSSGSTVTIDPTSDLNGGDNYTLTFSGIKSDKGEVMEAKSVTFKTAGIGLGTAPQSGSQVMYLQLNGNVVDLTGNATSSFKQVSWVADRFGAANSAANFNGSTAAGNGDIIELSGTKFINANTTISVWFKADPATFGPGSRSMFGCATERGYFMEIDGAMGWCKLATSHMVSPDPNMHYFGTAWTDPNGSGTHGGALQEYSGAMIDYLGTTWHQLVMTYDATSHIKTIYLDNVVMLQLNLANPPEWNLSDLAIANKEDGTGNAITGIDAKLTLGYYCSRANTATGWSDYSMATNTFKGAMDDFRIWNKALTSAEVTTLYNAEKP